MEFRISSIDIDKTLAKAQKIASRGQKKGLSGGFQVAVENRYEITNGATFEYPVLVIKGESLKYNGYEFIAVAEFIENQVIVKGIQDGQEVKSSDVKVGYCDHCQVERTRNKVIFIKSEEGKLSQVGSTCVKDFLGWDFHASALVTESDFENEFGGYIGGGNTGIDTVSVIAHAIKAVEKIGYVKSDSGSSTRNIVQGKINGVNSYVSQWKEYVGEDVTEADILKAIELIEWGKGFEGDSGYAENLRAVCQLKYQADSTIGIAVSLVKVFNNQIAQEIIKKEQVQFSKEQYAETGTKVELDVTCTGQNTFETQYGYTTLYTFVSGSSQFKWFSSSNADIETGVQIKIKGTVKGSDEHKEVFSTLLTRCKILS